MTNPTPLDTAREALAYRRIFLQPDCGADCDANGDGPFWCQDDLGPCEQCGKQWAEYALVPEAKQGTIPERESAWLIERGGTYYRELGGADWSVDPWRAKRFPTARAADNARLLLPDYYRDQSSVTEHVFVNKMPGLVPEAKQEGARPCTCHPDDNPPVPCPQRFAYSECVKAAKQDGRDQQDAKWLNFDDPVPSPDQAITYPPEMLPVAEDEAEVIVVTNDGSQRKVWPPDQATPSQGDVDASRRLVRDWAFGGDTASGLLDSRLTVLVNTIAARINAARAESRAEVAPPIDSAMELAELVTMNEGDYPVTATSGVLRAFFDDSEHTEAALEEAMARAEAAESSARKAGEEMRERPWNDISTAPKDGRWFGVVTSPGHLYRVSWGHGRHGGLGWYTVDGGFDMDGPYVRAWFDLPSAALPLPGDGEVGR